LPIQKYDITGSTGSGSSIAIPKASTAEAAAPPFFYDHDDEPEESVSFFVSTEEAQTSPENSKVTPTGKAACHENPFGDSPLSEQACQEWKESTTYPTFMTRCLKQTAKSLSPQKTSLLEEIQKPWRTNEA
jgi:hypothetical protein